MNIGSRLKQILEERNINVNQFARDSEVPAQTLYAMIKRDSNKADMDIMARILEALDMDLLEFLQMEPRKKKAAKKTVTKEPEMKIEIQQQEDKAEPEMRPESQKQIEPEEEIEPEIVQEPEPAPEPVRRNRRELADYLL